MWSGGGEGDNGGGEWWGLICVIVWAASTTLCSLGQSNWQNQDVLHPDKMVCQYKDQILICKFAFPF